MKNLYEVLNEYDPSITNNKDFKKTLKRFSPDVINELDVHGNTAIMHYVLYKRPLSYFVLETLICDFHASVNIPDRLGRLPLHAVLAPGTKTDIDIVRLLVRYTPAWNIIETVPEYPYNMSILKCAIVHFMNCDNAPEVLKMIIDKLPPEYIIPELTARTQNLFQILGFINDATSIEYTLQVLKRLELRLENQETDGGNSLLHTLHDSGFQLENEDLLRLENQVPETRKSLLYHATSSNNKELTKQLLEQSLDIVDGPVLDKFSQYNPEIQNRLQEDLRYFQRDIIIYNQLIHIPDAMISLEQMHSIMNKFNNPAVQDQAFYTSQKSSIISLISLSQYNFAMLYIQHADINILLKVYDNLDNNIFHIMALIKQYTAAQMEIVYDALAGIKQESLLTNANRLGQVPLTVAVLCGNKQFIQFYVKHRPDELKSQDLLGNSVVHTIAKTPLRVSDIQEILVNLLDFDKSYILSVRNKFGCSPIHDAVSAGNINFIRFWKAIGGSMEHLDNNNNLVLHYFARYSVASDPDNTDSQTADTTAIYNELYDIIDGQINLPNRFGITPFYHAFTNYNLLAIKLFLRDFASKVDFDSIEYHSGNTIAHNLISNYLNEVFYDERFANIMKALLPYKNNIKHHYALTNAQQETPLDIFEHRISALPIYLTTEIEEALQIMQTHKDDTFNEDTINTVNVLSLCIVYSKLTGFNDKLIHVLITGAPTILKINYVEALFQLLPPELLPDVCNSSNDLGQYPIHVAIVEGLDSAVNNILTLDPTLINQRTSNILLSDKLISKALTFSGHLQSDLFQNLFPADYAVLYNRPKILEILLQYAKRTNQNLSTRFIKEAKLIVPSDDLHAYFVEDTMIKLDINNRQSYLELVKLRTLEVHTMFKDYPVDDKVFKEMMQHSVVASKLFRNLSKKNYPVLYYNLDTLRKDLLSYHKHILLYSDDQLSQFFSVFLAIEGHATALVIFRDSKLQYHAYYQNSAGQDINPTLRNVMFMTLKIKESNIHSLNIPQQQFYEGNCGLWSILNIHIIQSVLSPHLVSYTRLGNKNLVTYTPELDTQIQDFMRSSKAREVLTLLESVYTKCTASHVKKRSILECNWTKLIEKIYNMFMKDRDALEVNSQKFYLLLQNLISTEQKLELTALKSNFEQHNTMNYAPFVIPSPTINMQESVDRNHAIFYLSLIYLNLAAKDYAPELETWISINGVIAETMMRHEDDKISELYKRANQFLETNPKQIILQELSPLLIPKYPFKLFFDNGQQLLLLSHDANGYRLYSLALDYRYCWSIKADTSFFEIRQFVQQFFMYCSGSSQYAVFTLSEQLPKNFIQSLRIEDFLNNKAWMPDDILVQTQESQMIEGVPLAKIIALFTIDGHSIEISDLYHPEFIKNNKERIKYKIELLHKIIVSLDYVQVSALISIIKNYGIGIDNTYIATLSEEDKIMFLGYSDKVDQLIKSSEAITLQQLSELSYETLSEALDKYSKELGGVRGHKIISAIKEYFSDDKNLKFIKSIGGHSIFFLPDMIRAYNTGNIDPLLSMSGMTAGDMLWNQLLEEMYQKLPNAKVALLKKISSGPIFNALLIYNIIELKQQLSTTDPDSRMSEALTGELYQSEAMIGLTLLRLTASLELTPIWVAVVITGIRSQGHMIAAQNDLKLNWWDEFKIGLDFEQEFLQYLITEERLFKINLATLNHVLANNMHGLFYIVKVPDLDPAQWITVDKEAVPQDILPHLTDASNIEEVVLYKNKSKSFVYGDYKYIINYNEKLQATNSFYQQAFYDAHTSISNIKFDRHTTSAHQRPSAMESVFIQSITYDNITWERIPPDPDLGVYTPWRMYYENNNPIYKFPDQYPMLRSTGYTAVYKPQSIMNSNTLQEYIYLLYPMLRSTGYTAVYKPQSITNSNTLQEYIYVLFDPREGSMTLDFTKKGLAIIKKQYSNGGNNSKYYVMVNIQHKPYPQSIVFNYTTDHKKFNLEDQTKKIISQYIINDDDIMSYKVQDNAAQSILVFTNNNGGNTNRCHTIAGIDNNIIVINNFEHHCNDLTSSAQSHNYISFKDKKILNIYCNNNYLISDSNLTFTSEKVYIDAVQGQSGRSQIICTNSTSSAHVGLIGNIIISDDNTEFTVVGIMPFSSNYSMTRVESDHYMIELNSKSLLTLSVQKYLQKSSIVVLVRQENNLLYNWTSNTIQETLSLQGFDDKSYLKRYVLHVSDDITFLSVQDQYINITLNDSLNLAHYIIHYYIKQIVQNSDLKGSVQDEQGLQDTLSYCTNDVITLQHRGLEPRAIDALIHALEISQCNIKIINLSGNNISDHFPLLLQALESVQGLKVLQFIKSSIGSDEAILLWRKLPSMHLSTIDLSYNNIDKKLLDYLSNYTKCPTLSAVTIDISDNKLSTEQEQLLSNKNVCANIKVMYGISWLGSTSLEDSLNNKSLLQKRSIHTTEAIEYDNQDHNGHILYTTSGAGSSCPIGYQLMQYLGGAIHSIYNTVVSTWRNQHVSNTEFLSTNTLNASIDQLHATESDIIEDISFVPNILQAWISDDTTSTNNTIHPVINFNNLLISANYFIRILAGHKDPASELMLNHHAVIPENQNLKYAQRLAYSGYAHDMEANNEHIELHHQVKILGTFEYCNNSSL